MPIALRPLLLLVALAVNLPAHAQDPASESLSQREAAEARVQQVERDGGRVLQAEPMQRGGREVYRLKVLTPEGRVRVQYDSRARDPRGDRLDSARQSPMLRDRQRPRDDEPRREAPPPEARRQARPEPRDLPRRAEGDRSGGGPAR